MASHYVDAIHQWIGPFERVSADLRAVVTERAIPDGSRVERVTADDTVLLAFRLENGATGRIDVSCAAPGGMRRMEVFGPRGGLVIESGKLYRPVQGKLEEIQPEAHELGRLEDPRLGPFVELGQRLVDRINGADSGAIPTFADGFEVQRVMDAAHRSSDEGREVRIAEID
jgi:predicted dehydrogenase